MRQHYAIIATARFLANARGALSALFLTGCTMATVPPAQLANADYGSVPANYEEIVREYVSKGLKDPFSAVFEFSLPFRGYTRKAPVRGGGVDQFGYVVAVRVNAKNSFGAFVGFKTYRFLVRDGAVRTEIVSNSFFSEPWYQCPDQVDIVGVCVP